MLSGQMLVATILLASAAASASAAATAPKYIPTPVGRVLSHCVHEVAEGSHITEQDDGSTHVEAPDGTIQLFPRCDAQAEHPVLLRHAAAPSLGGRPLPPDYDGWLQYTALNVTRLGLEGGFDAFTNIMSVPDVPAEPADQLFLFPGLQNVDWIPKVDPEPTAAHPFDIIQPVLQYPGSFFHPHSWLVKSWYVTMNAGAIYSTGIPVAAGDSILCNMTRTGPQDWTVVATLQSNGKHTTQSASNARLKLQPWAYNTLECYGCSGCETYPKQPITFTKNALYQGGKLVPVNGSQWAVNPKPAKQLQCHERTTVAPNGDTTIAFQ